MNRRAFLAALPAGLLACLSAPADAVSASDDGIVYLSAPRTRFRVKQRWEDAQVKQQRAFVAAKHPCPVCDRPLIWAEDRVAEDTSPTSTSRTFCSLGKIYYHVDGTRCHRDYYALVPVKGVIVRAPGAPA